MYQKSISLLWIALNLLGTAQYCSLATITIGLTSSLDFGYLSNLTTTERNKLFGTSDFNFKIVNEPTVSTYTEFLSENERIKNENLTCIIGNDNGNLELIAQTNRIPLYINQVAVTSKLLLPTSSFENSTIFLADLTLKNLVAATMDIVKLLGGRKEVFLIGDGSLERIAYILTLASDIELHFTAVTPRSSARDIRRQLLSMKRVVNVAQSAYVILTNSTNHHLVQSILESATHLSMLTNTSMWIVTSLFIDTAHILPYYGTGARILRFQAKNPNVTDRSTYEKEILHDIINHYVKAVTSRDLVNVTDIMEKLLETNYTSINGLMVFDRKTRQNNYMEFLVLETSRTRNDSLPVVATWKNALTEKFISNMTSASIPTLVVSGRFESPFVTNGTTSASLGITGLSVSLLEEIKKTVSFNYRIVLVADGASGSRTAGGDWNGIIGELVNKRADMSLNVLTKTEERAKERRIIISAVPVMRAGKAILIHTPGGETDFFIKPLYPLSWNVWFAIILAFLILSATLYATDKISPNDMSRSMYGVTDALFYVYSSFVMSKLPTNPIKPSARIFILILWFASLMYVFSYATNFFFMVVSKDDNVDFNSIAQLKNHSATHYWMFTGGGSTEAFFQNGTGVYKEMYDQAVKEWPDLMYVDSSTEAVTQIINKNSEARKPAYIGDETTVSYLANTNCQLKIVGAENAIDRQGLHIFYREGLDPSLVTAIDKRLQELSDDGTIDRLQERYWAEKQCSSAANLIDQKDLPPVQFLELAGSYILLAGGCGLALIAVMIEFIIYKMTLFCQRYKSDTKLYFKKEYIADVASITLNGIYIRIPGVDGLHYLRNYQLCMDNDRGLNATDLGINNNDKIFVVYLGNDPYTGNRLFQKLR